MTEAAGIAGCTTVTASYAAFARVLSTRWREFHPNLPFYVLLLDGDPSTLSGSGFGVLTAEDLGLSQEELQIRRAIYDPFELATSLKAELLRTLLSRGHDAVIFLDSDTGIYENIEDVGVAAAEHGVALSPHMLRPPPLDGLYPSEVDIPLRYGVFNSGFIAVGHDATAFLDWWSEHVRRDCIDDLDSGLHVDQYWLQSVPTYFPYTLLLDPTLHVAYWNVHERNVERVEGRYLVDGAPLRTFHFSGFDPERPDRLNRYPTPIPFRVDPSRNPGIFRLLADYAAELLQAGYRESRALGYAYAASASGTPARQMGARCLSRSGARRGGRGSGRPPEPVRSGGLGRIRAALGSVAFRRSSSRASRKAAQGRQEGVRRARGARRSARRTCRPWHATSSETGFSAASTGLRVPAAGPHSNTRLVAGNRSQPTAATPREREKSSRLCRSSRPRAAAEPCTGGTAGRWVSRQAI